MTRVVLPLLESAFSRERVPEPQGSEKGKTLMRKYLTIIAAVLGMSLLGITTASASEEPFVATDTAAGGVATPSSASAVSADMVTLVQDGRVTATAGTSAETSNLGVEVAAGETVTVDYELTGGADFAAGAVRLFIYYSAGADTWNQAPDQFVAADAASGTLSITAAGGTVGTAGVVYDTSNPSKGTATFSNLTVAGEAVPFLPVEDPKDEDPVDEDPKDEEPKGDDDEEPAPAPKDEEPKDDDTTPVADDDGELPDTGGSTMPLIGAGVLLTLGAGAFGLRKMLN